MIVPVTFILLIALLCALGNAQETCTLCPGSSTVYCINLPTTSPIGTFVGLHVQFSSSRKLPLLSHAVLNGLNHQHLVPRNDTFRRHQCTSIVDNQCECNIGYRATPEQVEYGNSGMTPFDRGHLTPSHAFTYSSDANHATMFCINLAPQDGFTNRGPWSTLETIVLDFFKSPRAGYVMTGVCDTNAAGLHSPTLDGFPVPSCFWKMACYNNDTSGTVRVVGFIADNTIIPSGDEGRQSVRRILTFTPRAQQDVLDRIQNVNNLALVRGAWATGSTALLPGRNEANLPSAAQCRAALTLPNVVRDEWASYFPNL